MKRNKEVISISEIIKKSEAEHIKNGGKPFGKVFSYYESDTGIIYAFDENNRRYTFDGFDLCPSFNNYLDPYWSVVTYEELVSYVRMVRRGRK